MRIEEAVNQIPHFLTPEEVLKELGLKEGDVVLDYGSGAGHWSVPAAKITGLKGRVFAIDDDINILKMLQSKAEIRRITNIEIEELNFEKEESSFDGKADLIIVANVLHVIKNKDKFAKRFVKYLKSDGQILVIDWVCSNDTLFGPPDSVRVCEEDVVTLFENANFHLCRTVNAGSHHFGLVFDIGGKSAKN